MSHETIAHTASQATYTGATVAASSAVAPLVFGLSVAQWSVLGVIFGMLMALAGWVTNLYFKRAHLKLSEAALEKGIPPAEAE